jgi:hypothetical protein
MNCAFARGVGWLYDEPTLAEPYRDSRFWTIGGDLLALLDRVPDDAQGDIGERLPTHRCWIPGLLAAQLAAARIDHGKTSGIERRWCLLSALSALTVATRTTGMLTVAALPSPCPASGVPVPSWLPADPLGTRTITTSPSSSWSACPSNSRIALTRPTSMPFAAGARHGSAGL